jgi:hypothetical protein
MTWWLIIAGIALVSAGAAWGLLRLAGFVAAWLSRR